MPLVVGRRREVEVVMAALAAGRHVLLEGPPGTGKSTVLAAVASTVGMGFVFVEGNAELTPARLVGHHDPARVLAEGYRAEIFEDGPLLTAMREGALLYLEEINRIPEETLNVLVTVMSDGALQVPRLGRVEAAASFRLVAAMNPFDAVGTARISAAIYDRTCRVLMGYQSAAEEQEIVRRKLAESPAAPPIDQAWIARVVDLVRRTRSHPDIRVGSSVRGAVDLVLLASELARLRHRTAEDPEVSLDATLAALSGRIRLHEGAGRTPEDVLGELWHEVLGRQRPAPGEEQAATGPAATASPTPGASDGRGKAPAPGGPAPTGG